MNAPEENNNHGHPHPPGIELIGERFRNLNGYRCVVLLVTFIAYTSYHASRKPTSIVKSVLAPIPNANLTEFRPWPIGGHIFIQRIGNSSANNTGWAPFDQTDGTSLLGTIDLVFLSCYAMGMYVAGHLADRMDLRLFLTFGMFGSGIFVALFGMGYFFNIHDFCFYFAMQMVAGAFQSSGWPSVVAVVGNWYRGGRRGLIMGVWNSHTSIGNITGSFLAGVLLKYGWGWSFILPGAFIFLSGVLVFLFLPAYPEDYGIQVPDEPETPPEAASAQAALQYPFLRDPSQVVDEETGMRPLEEIGDDDDEDEDEITEVVPPAAEDGHINPNPNPPPAEENRGNGGIGLRGAFSVPGVIPYAVCLFFAKLVAYTFLFWLPYYITQTGIGGKAMTVENAGYRSGFFDAGGIIGGVVAGYVSDRIRCRATTAALFLYLAAPAMMAFRKFGSISQVYHISLMMVAGFFVNGPYALITTAVSADLGNHATVAGNARALATVTAIIDGTGSLGAALGPLLTGILSRMGWDDVFYMLYGCSVLAGGVITHIAVAEIDARLMAYVNAEGDLPFMSWLLYSDDELLTF